MPSPDENQLEVLRKDAEDKNIVFEDLYEEAGAATEAIDSARDHDGYIVAYQQAARAKIRSYEAEKAAKGALEAYETAGCLLSLVRGKPPATSDNKLDEAASHTASHADVLAKGAEESAKEALALYANAQSLALAKAKDYKESSYLPIKGYAALALAVATAVEEAANAKAKIATANAKVAAAKREAAEAEEEHIIASHKVFQKSHIAIEALADLA